MAAVKTPSLILIDRIWLVLAISIAMAVTPLFAAELMVLAHLSMYQFFPLVYLFALIVGWLRWDKAQGTIGNRAGSSLWPELICIAIAFACLTVHAGLFGPWLGGVAGFSAGAAGILAVGRLRRVQLWDLWCLLVITSRLPLDLNARLSVALQSFSSQLSSFVLDIFGIFHVLAGNIVKIPSGDLMVAEACSGVNSIMSIIACAMMIAIWNERTWIHTVLLLVMGVFFTILTNVIRIVTIAVAQDIFQFDLSHGILHTLFGLMMFVLAFWSLMKTDYLFLSWLEHDPTTETDENQRNTWLNGIRRRANFRLFPTPPRVTPGKERRNDGEFLSFRILYAGLAVLGIAMGCYHSYALYASYTQNGVDSSGIVERAKKIDRRIIEAAVAPWTIVDDYFQEREVLSELAPFSKIYVLQHPNFEARATLSFDFPFYRRWHDVTKCYVASGEKLDKRIVHRDANGSNLQDCEYVEAELQLPAKGYRHLLFANLNQDGKLVAPPSEVGNLGYALNQVVHTYQQRRQVSLNPNKLFQVQVFNTENKPQSPELRKELELLFYRAMHVLRIFLAESSSPARSGG